MGLRALQTTKWVWQMATSITWQKSSVLLRCASLLWDVFLLFIADGNTSQ